VPYRAKIHKPRNKPTPRPRPRVRTESRRLRDKQVFRDFRVSFLADNPACGVCDDVATDVHHVRGLEDYPEDLCDAEHCQALCHSCDSRLTGQGEGSSRKDRRRR